MSKFRAPRQSIREISVNPQPSGHRAVYLVITRSPEEAREIGMLFSELETSIQVKQLCKGELVSYAVQAHESDAALLDEIESMLKANYGFVVTHRSFDDVIYRIVKELCEETGSKMLSIPRCNICGKIEPFPNTTINMSNEDGSISVSRAYCRRCTAEAIAPTNKQFVKSLLAADSRDFGAIEKAELERRPSRNQPMRFRVKPKA